MLRMSTAASTQALVKSLICKILRQSGRKNAGWPAHTRLHTQRLPFAKWPPNGGVQARCEAQRSNVACNPVLARALRLQSPFGLACLRFGKTYADKPTR